MKIWVIKRKTIIAFSIIFFGILSFFLIGRGNSMAVSGQKRDLPIYCVDKNEEKIVSISFDAAWGNEDTEQLIEIENVDVIRYNGMLTAWIGKIYPRVRLPNE